MFIESLRIDGIKGGPVEYHLGPLVCIEGPNGSGKSRIMDAIRFLFGADPAGVAVEGRAMADLMAGDRLFVEAVITDSDRRIVASRERVIEGGTFRRSALVIDGQPASADDLPSVRLGAGRPLVYASDEVTAAELARIGAASLDPEPIDLIEAATAQAIEGWQPDTSRPAGDRIGAVFAAVKAERRRLRTDAAEASASAERSRQSFGTVHIQIGEAARWSSIAEDAAQKVANISRDIGAIEADLGSAMMRRRKIEQRLSERAEAGAEAFDSLRARAIAASEAHGPARAALDAANDAVVGAKTVFEAAERAVAIAEDKARRAAERRDQAAAVAAQLDGVPCRRSPEWVTVDEITANPLAGGVDLCGGCPLSASAREQDQALGALEARVASAIEAGKEAGVAWAKAADDLRAVKAAATLAADRELTLRRALETATARLRKAEQAAEMTVERADELRAEYESLGAEIDRQTRALAERKAELERVVARRVEAKRKADEGRIAEERLRRLRADEAQAREVEERVEAVKTLAALAKRVRDRFVSAGLDTIRAHGGPVVEWMHDLDLDGRIGLRGPKGRFWSGPGLSAAQAELLGVALDVAIARIDGAVYRPMMVEADPLDGDARRAVVDAAARLLTSGDVTQVFIASWLRVEATRAVNEINIDRIEVKA
jgi:chromosome segregation protein